MHLVSLSLYSLKRCCLTRSLFNKSGFVSWGFSSRKQRLGDMSLTLLQPYLPSLIVTLFEIHASVEFDVFFVCWGLLLVLYFSSHHLDHLSSLDEFSGQYDPSFSLLPVNTELKYYFILFFSQVNRISFVSVHSSGDFQYNPSFSFLPVSTELKYNLNLVTCVSFLWALSVFSINPLYCIDIGSFYIQLFQLRLWDSHRVRHSVCSLF